MTAAENNQIRLGARPVGLPKDSDWTYTKEPVGEPGDGHVVVKVLYLSLDPAMRGWMNEGRSYIEPVRLGDVMRAGGVGRVVASAHPGFSEGDVVTGGLNVQEYATLPAGALKKLESLPVALPAALNVLGMPGMTAYFGLLDVGALKTGDTVVVSGAAGAVGSTVGQIAKIKGARAVGIAGGPEKCKYIVDELGFDAAIDYKSEDLAQGLRTHCKDGIDVYFDNVGGETLDTCLTRIARRARIVICGAISQYNATAPVAGPKNYLSLLVNRARMEGMVVFDFADRFPQAEREMTQWIQDGKLKSREHIVHGLETFHETLLKLFSGENFGKLVLRVAPE